jgi:hypothetical protein
MEEIAAQHIHQCPRCECRYSNFWELEEHLRADHGVEGLQPIPETRHRLWSVQKKDQQ